MRHDENLLLCKKKFFKGLSLNTRLNTRSLFCTCTLSTVVGNLLAVLNSCLVTASAHSHTDGCTCIFVSRCITAGGLSLVSTDTDTESHRDVISDIDCLNIIKDRELVVPESLHVLLSEDEEVLIILDMLYDCVDVAEVHIDLTLNQSGQDRMLNILKRIHNLIVIIKIKKSDVELLIYNFLLIFLKLGLIKEVECDNDVRYLILALVLTLENL